MNYGSNGAHLNKFGPGSDYENIGMMDSQTFHLTNKLTQSFRSPNSPTPSKNSIGLPLGTYPSPLLSSQSSKSSTVSSEKDKCMLRITPSSSSSNLYTNMATRIHHSPQPFLGMSPFNHPISLAKREIIRPKSTSNEGGKLSFATANIISSSKEEPTGKISHDCMAIHYLGNSILSKSELSLNSLSINKDCSQASSTNQNETLTELPPSSSPSSSSASANHRISHQYISESGESKISCGLPLFNQQTSSNTMTTISNPPINRGVNSIKIGNKESGSNLWPEWPTENTAWSSPIINRRMNDKTGCNHSYNGTVMPTFLTPNQSSANNNQGVEYSINNRGIKPSIKNQFNYPRSNSLSNRIKIRNGSHKSSGSSCSGSSTSTVQDDILKLLNPDFLMQSNTGDCESNSNTSGGETSTSQYSTPYSSLERSSTKEMPYKDPGQVILTVAQPAQVIFSQPSSPSDFPKGKDASSLSTPSSSLSRSHSIAYLPQAQSPSPSASKGENTLSSINLPLTDEEGTMDWPTLVDTATKAIAENNRNSPYSGDDGVRNSATTALDHWLREFGANVTSSNGLASLNHLRSGENFKELEDTVKKLQYDLVREQSDKANLLEQVKSLKEENIRLVEESKTAAAQLRKFTEWFFQNINPR